MEVPATRPEVTTTGIYGEELNVVRQSLQRSDLCWFGDLTSRTQVLIVGSVACAPSRKLFVARKRGLPCVSIEWVKDGGCAMDSTDRFDIAHWVTGKEVCTTGLHHHERERVEVVCGARHAAYNALLTRHCGLLVASAAALAFTSLSGSYSAASNDKVRFARRHRVPIITMEEFTLRYALDHHPLSEGTAPGQVVCDVSSLKASSGISRVSSNITHTGVACEQGRSIGCSLAAASAGDHTISNANEVLAGDSVRPSLLPRRSATPTPRTSLATCGHSAADTQGLHNTEEAWGGCGTMVPRSVRPSLSSSEIMHTSSASVCNSLQGPSRHILADELSDVVAYCSPPHRLTAHQRDLLSGMGVTLSPKLTPSTTHVLVLGDAVEECLFPRPGLQVVSWEWVSRCQLEQRRLSCLGFRVECVFRPVITFTGLALADRHALVSAFRHSGLPGEVQDALVLCGSNGGVSGRTPRHSSEPIRNPYLPSNTTHLVAPRSQLLSSPKVAMLAQHHYQHASRPHPHSATLLASSSACHLVGVDWIYRSIQQKQWLDADLFTLTIPTPEAFTVATTVRPTVPRATPPLNIQVAEKRSSVAPCVVQHPLKSVTATNLSVQTVLLHPPFSPQSAFQQDAMECNFGNALSKPVPAEGTVERGVEEEAASSQQRNTHAGHTAESISTTPLLHGARDDDDEEAGGESPSTSAAARSGPQSIHTTPLQSSPVLSQNVISPSAVGGKREEVLVCADADLATALHHHTEPSFSSTNLATQFSPSFEKLLGELEAGPPETLLRAFPAHVSPRSYHPPPITASVSLLSTSVGGEAKARDQRAASDSMTPPSTGADGCIERRSFLCRPFAQPHMIGQQQQMVCCSMSNESQVVFYQMGLGDDDGSGTVLRSVSHDHSHVVPRNGAGQTATEAAAPSARGPAGAVADAYPPSISSSAVLLISKDVLRGGLDWDSFASCFPQVQRTTKPEECTHFITATLSKTEQFLCCLAAGHWILTPAYLRACLEMRYLVSEAPFEWNAEVALALGCRSSVASLARGCRVQREAPQLPFVSWRARVCCINSARAASFLRVLRSGGCTSLRAVTAADVMASSNEPGIAPPSSTDLVLADDSVFTEDELDELASRPASLRCPIMRLEYLVQFLCLSDTSLSGMNLLSCSRSRKRTRTRSTEVE